MAAALETVGAAAAEVVEEVLAALLTGASFLAQAAAKHTTPAITTTRSNDEDLMNSTDMVYILPLIYVIRKAFSITPWVKSVKPLGVPKFRD
ncbi:MAG: hypothetical protein ACYC45_10210 [Acidithiobacillus ferriphilus]